MSSSVPKEILMLSRDDYINLNVSNSKKESIFYKSLLNNRVYHLFCWCKGESSKNSEDISQTGYNPSNHHYSAKELENCNDYLSGMNFTNSTIIKKKEQIWRTAASFERGRNTILLTPIMPVKSFEIG